MLGDSMVPCILGSSRWIRLSLCFSIPPRWVTLALCGYSINGLPKESSMYEGNDLGTVCWEDVEGGLSRVRSSKTILGKDLVGMASI